MHRFPNKPIIIRFKLAALLLCIKYLMAPLVAGMLIYSLTINDFKLTKTSIAALILTILVVIAQWLLAIRTRCPLCMVPVLATKGCSKHRKARSFLGSHRLKTAVDIVFKGSFRCPYCNESSAMEVRVRRQQPNVRHH